MPGRRLRQQQRPRRGLAEPRREQRRARRAAAPRAPRPRPASGSSSVGSGGSSVSGNRTTNPSSPHIVSTSSPSRLRSCARRPPSPTARGCGRRAATARRSASRRARRGTRSMTIVRSSGTRRRPRPDRRGSARRFSAALLDRDRACVDQPLHRTRRRQLPQGSARARRCARPSSSGRPAAVAPSRTASCPAAPGAGETSSAIAGDLLDSPGRGAEQERLADPALERSHGHLLESRVGETFLLGASRLAHRGDHPRSCSRLPGSRRAGQDAVLERGQGRTTDRARHVIGKPVRTCGRCLPTPPVTTGACITTSTPGRREPPCATSMTRLRQRAPSPTIAPLSSNAALMSSATGGSASFRRSAAASMRPGPWPLDAPATVTGVDVETMWSDEGFVSVSGGREPARSSAA